MATQNTWILTADSARARILEVLPREQRLLERQVFQNPEGRAHNRDLETGGHPRFNGHGGVGKPGTAPTGGPGNDREQISPSEKSADAFAKEIARFLDKARIEHRFERLYLIAPPRFLGALRQELGKEVEKLVADELDKDLSWFNAREIESYLRPASSGFAQGSAQAR
jgi:protein required for attachment to host cells